MGKFTAVPGLDEIVASMAVQHVTGVAREVEDEAKRLAPPTKEWSSMGDGAVRSQHRRVNGQVRPENLRFDLTAYRWDVENPGAMGALSNRTVGGNKSQGDDGKDLVEGAHTYLMYPRDQSAGAYVAVVNCRCVLLVHADGISKLVKRTATKQSGTKVKALVYAQGELVVEAELGDVYAPTNLWSPGTYFMRRAAVAVATRRSARSPRR